MIYKFEDGEAQKSLLIEQNHFKTIGVTIYDEMSLNDTCFTLNEDQIYDLIGCSHSLQSKIKKGDNDGTTSKK